MRYIRNLKNLIIYSIETVENTRKRLVKNEKNYSQSFYKYSRYLRKDVNCFDEVE